MNFAIYSDSAKAVELLLFDSDMDEPISRIPLLRSSNIWHVHVQNLRAGQMYAYSVDGPYEPKRGLRFNRNKTLLDPYSRLIVGSTSWDAKQAGYNPRDPGLDLSFDERDSDAVTAKSVVVDPYYDWKDDKPPLIHWRQMVIYETHVKGLTMLNQVVNPDDRGTFRR